jgi:hypothetical protein
MLSRIWLSAAAAAAAACCRSDNNTPVAKLLLLLLLLLSAIIGSTHRIAAVTCLWFDSSELKQATSCCLRMVGTLLACYTAQRRSKPICLHWLHAYLIELLQCITALSCCWQMVEVCLLTGEGRTKHTAAAKLCVCIGYMHS